MNLANRNLAVLFGCNSNRAFSAMIQEIINQILLLVKAIRNLFHPAAQKWSICCQVTQKIRGNLQMMKIKHKLEKEIRKVSLKVRTPVC